MKPNWINIGKGVLVLLAVAIINEYLQTPSPLAMVSGAVAVICSMAVWQIFDYRG